MKKPTKRKSQASEFLESTHQACVVRTLHRIEQAGYAITCAGDMNAAKRGPRAIAEARMTGLAKGEPDVRVYVLGGVLLMFELKTEKGKISPDQIERHARLRALGHKVATVKNQNPLDTATEIAKRVALELNFPPDKFDNHAKIATNEILVAIGRT